jgi:phage terminase large subunit-like protein|tara:strand:- start:10408 stop:11883 length:1476 start_codon:yes stop_codon:yes gene_type:complete
VSLSELAKALATVERTAQQSPLDYYQWLPCQYQFLKSTEKRLLLRAGNQFAGKTTAGVAELIYRLMGKHPYKWVNPGPINALVVCASHEQTLNIQGRINAMIDDSLLHERCRFDVGTGKYYGKYPTVRLKNGSSCQFRSGSGDTLNLAGLTVDYLWLDEPPKTPRVYSEASKRVLRSNGDIRLTLTPVNANVEWLRLAVESGQIKEVHTRLTPEACIPVGSALPMRLGDGTLADAKWIEALIADTLAHEVPVVCHGEWNMASQLACFTAWNPTKMVTRQLPSHDVELLLGVDHGAGKLGSSYAVIVAVDHAVGEAMPTVWVVGEYSSADECTADDDAAGILSALYDCGIKYRQLDKVWGDRAHHGSNRRGSVAKKSNALLASALGRASAAQMHGIGPANVVPPVRNAKRGKGGANAPGAVSWGVGYLHRLMLRDKLKVHPRCTELAKAMSNYDMKPNTKYAHPVDALRYALRDVIYGAGARTRSAPSIKIR